MPLVDMPLSELRTYCPELTAEVDFDSFWQQYREESAQKPLHATLTLIDYPIKSIEVYRLQYEGIDGTPIRGWYIVPKSPLAKKPMPVVIHYHGYSGNAGKPHDYLTWASMGIATITVDTRGQAGHTPDHARYASGAVIGWMTLGIEDPHQYYYKYAYMDCVRAIDFAVSREELDSLRIALTGNSQGGGLVLAVAGIDARPKLAMPIFPYLTHFKRAVELHTQGPYVEIKNWFRMYDPEHLREDEIYRTLSYFDGMNHAARIRAKTLMAITLQDVICPPSTCFAAYHHLSCDKELRVYPDYGHEALPFHTEEMMRFVHMHL